MTYKCAQQSAKDSVMQAPVIAKHRIGGPSTVLEDDVLSRPAGAKQYDLREVIIHAPELLYRQQSVALV
jgi:hypothetical protein